MSQNECDNDVACRFSGTELQFFVETRIYISYAMGKYKKQKVKTHVTNFIYDISTTFSDFSIYFLALQKLWGCLSMTWSEEEEDARK